MWNLTLPETFTYDIGIALISSISGGIIASIVTIDLIYEKNKVNTYNDQIIKAIRELKANYQKIDPNAIETQLEIFNEKFIKNQWVGLDKIEYANKFGKSSMDYITSEEIKKLFSENLISYSSLPDLERQFETIIKSIDLFNTKTQQEEIKLNSFLLKMRANAVLQPSEIMGQIKVVQDRIREIYHEAFYQTLPTFKSIVDEDEEKYLIKFFSLKFLFNKIKKSILKILKWKKG